MYIKHMIRMYLAILFLTLMTGCSLRPVNSEKKDFFAKPEFKSDIVGNIKAEAEPDGFLVTDESALKREILSEIRQSGKAHVDSTDGPELKFKFHKCEKTESYPTQSTPLNVAIHVGTLFLWPVGNLYTCRATLTVSNPNLPTKLYTSEVKAEDFGQLFLYMMIYKPPSGWGLRGLAARRLLQQYEGDSSKSVQSNP